MLCTIYLKRIVFAAMLIICSGIISFGQNAELIKFEKSINEGDFSRIERDVLNYAIKNPKDAKAFELLGKIRFLQERFNEAKSLFTRALVLDPNLITAKINLAETYYKIGEFENAKSYLDKISTVDVKDDETRLSLAEVYSGANNCEKALLFSEKLSPQIKDTKALPLRAKCFIQTERQSQLNNLFTLARKLKEKDVGIVLELAKVLQKASMQNESADILNNALLKLPNNEELLILLTKAEIFSKKFSSANRYISKIERLNSQSQNLLFIKGLLEFEQGNATEAVILLEKYLVFNPESIEAIRYFVISAMRSKQAGKAVRGAGKLIELSPNETEFLYLFGAASLQNGNLDKAEQSLRKFMESHPNDSQGCLALGLTYAAQPEKFEIARKQMRKCIEIDANNYEAKYQLGLSYRKQGETAEAISYLEAVVGQKTDYSNALRDLGSLYVQNSQEKKARIVLEKAVLLNPKDADTHFQLSRLYNLIGEQNLAKKHLKIFQGLRSGKTGGM